MNPKIIYRILGALASALIIVGVFVPFVSVTGYTQSIWGLYSTLDTAYLPIMIIVFGAIGVLFFSLDFKTEFAYMSTGAVLFFIIMQTIDVIDQGTFSTLSIGYYFLAIGAVLTGVIAFLSNIKQKENITPVSINNSNNTQNLMNQIDKLYNDALIQTAEPKQINTETISPIPVQPIQFDNNSNIGNVNEQPIPEISTQQIQPQQVEFQPQMNPQVIPQVEQNKMTQPSTSNPVVQEFMNNVPNTNLTSTSQTQTQVPVQPETEFNVPLTNINEEPKPNPVVQEFSNPQQSIPTTQTQENTGLDIFGQSLK